MEYRRILRIPLRISGGALSCPDSFGGVSLAIDNNEGDTIVVTQMRNYLLSNIARSRNGPSARRALPEVGAISARREGERLLIPSYPNCIISHASPSRERLGNREKYTASLPERQREPRMYRISPRARRSSHDRIFSREPRKCMQLQM